jgi:hypothetical protein
MKKKQKKNNATQSIENTELFRQRIRSLWGPVPVLNAGSEDPDPNPTFRLTKVTDPGN